MSGQVESDAESLLSGFDVVSIEFIRFFDGRKAGVLSDGPWSLGVHGRIWATGVRKLPRELNAMSPDNKIILKTEKKYLVGCLGYRIFTGIDGLYRNAFRRVPNESVRIFPLHRLGRVFHPSFIQRLLRMHSAVTRCRCLQMLLKRHVDEKL